jgi:hypothetical protein
LTRRGTRNQYLLMRKKVVYEALDPKGSVRYLSQLKQLSRSNRKRKKNMDRSIDEKENWF